MNVESKRMFETEIHPLALNKFQCNQNEMNDYICHLIFDVVGIPLKKIELRQFYIDCINEHFSRNSITEKHLTESLISWKENGIIKQAE